MPRPVCVRCGREMTWIKAVSVQINARAVRGPYQQWRGDLCRCPNCGAEVVARFADEPEWQHFHGDTERDRQPDVIVDEVGHG